VNRRFASTSIVALAMFSASPVWAANITYDFAGDAASNPLGLPTGNLGTSINVAQDGVAVTISGFSPTNAPASLDRSVCCGLGVADGTNGNSIGIGEAIEFAFSGSLMVVGGRYPYPRGWLQ
jgi:hypothetical protein